MTIPDLPSTARLAVRETGFLVRPIPVFIALSLLFGIALVAVSPPLRGPDETAHFLRAYGIAQGEFVPTSEDGRGRKGVMLPSPGSWPVLTISTGCKTDPGGMAVSLSAGLPRVPQRATARRRGADVRALFRVGRLLAARLSAAERRRCGRRPARSRFPQHVLSDAIRRPACLHRRGRARHDARAGAGLAVLRHRAAALRRCTAAP